VPTLSDIFDSIYRLTMKNHIFSAAFLVTSSLAAKPQLTVQVRDGKFDEFEGLEPSFTWETKGTSGEYELECGIDIAARPTTDLASLPKSIWGKAQREYKGWDLSGRAEVQADVPNQAKVELEGDNEEEDVNVKIFASAGKKMSVARVEATKGFESGDARVTVNPRYDVDHEDGDVILGWAKDKTEIELIADRDNQSIKISQQLDDDNRVAPMYASNGTVAVEWERQLGEDNSVLTKITPNECIEVEWHDHDWTANVEVPIEGTKVGGPAVTIKREVKF